MIRGIRSCFSSMGKCFPCSPRVGCNGDPDEESNEDFDSVISLTFLDDGPEAVRNIAKARKLEAKLKKELANKEKALAKKARQDEKKERKMAKAQAKMNKKEEVAALASVPIEVRMFLDEVIQLVVAKVEAKVEAKAEAKADVTVDGTVLAVDESSGQTGCC